MKGILTAALILVASQAVWAIDVTSGLTPQHSVSADFDNDGRVDLAVANTFDDTVAIHLQDGSGDFPLTQSVVVGINNPVPSNFPRFLLSQDINRDGFADLIVLCSGNFAFGFQPSVQTLINLGNGAFGHVPASPTTGAFTSEEFPVQFAQGEFTGDHYPDLAVANLQKKTVRILEGNGTGAFEVGQEISLDTGGEGPQDLVAFDGDEDGLIDLWVVTSNSFAVLKQTPAGSFAAPAFFTLSGSPTGLRALVLDDLDGDGELDAALADTISIQVLYSVQSDGNALSVAAATDASFSGCSDIATVLWDGDQLPDIAVCNRTGDRVSVVLSTGSVEVLPTGKNPRRLEAQSDLDQDGRLDLLTANEGDQTLPQNVDANVFLNPGSPTSNLSAGPVGEWPLLPALGFELSRAQALAFGEEDGEFWVLEADRRFIQGIDEDGLPTFRVEFPFVIGGLSMKGEDEGVVVERFSSRIHEFKVESSGELKLEDPLAFVFAPGDLGYCGLGFDREAEEFYISVPAVEKILRMNEDGDILTQISVPIPPWDLAWDGSSQRLFATHPGRSDVRAYTSAGVLDAARSYDLQDESKAFETTGLAGISWFREENRIRVLTSAGTLLENPRADLAEAVPLSLAGDVQGIDLDNGRGEVYVLDESGFYTRLEFPGLAGRESFSLWSVMASDPLFVPAGICVDPGSGAILVGDRWRPIAARFSREGVPLGWDDYSTDLGSPPGPFGGIDREGTGNRVALRKRLSFEFGPPGVSLPASFLRLEDIAWDAGKLVTLGRNPGEILFFDPETGGSPEVLVLEIPRSECGIATDGAGRVVLLSENGDPIFQVYGIESLSSVENWDAYR